MWRYDVGHARLLFRSPKSADHPTRVDVLFKNVAAIHMPTLFTGMAIRSGPRSLPSDPRNLGTSGGTIFEITGDNVSGHIIAGAVVAREDEGSHGDPSPLWT